MLYFHKNMVKWLLFSRVGSYVDLCGCRLGFNYQQKCSLVNLKLKWVKDRVLDAVVTKEKGLKAASVLVTVISSTPKCCLPIDSLSCHRGQLGLSNDLKLLTFLRKYPSVFAESYVLDSGATRVPCFSLTDEALKVREEEVDVFEQNQLDILNRLRKLLMLTRDWTLPLQTIDQLRWDLGLPYDYRHSFLPNYSDIFSHVQLPHERVGLQLKFWDNDLAVSELQKKSASQQKEDDLKNGNLAFPIGFTRGFGLKRKCLEWLRDWQKLPYTSPYSDASHLDPRTDVSEKRNVGVFHEILHLTLHKKTERKNVSNLRKRLALPQKFTKVFERHPGIFYISMKCATQTVILREAYNRQILLQKHPLVNIREKYASLLRQDHLDRRRGFYKNTAGLVLKKDPSKHDYDVVTSDGWSSSEEEPDNININFEF